MSQVPLVAGLETARRLVRGDHFAGLRADDEMSDRWRAIVSATHLAWSTRVTPAPRFRAAVRRWWIDDLALVDVECAPTSGSRGRSQIAAADGEFVAPIGVIAHRWGFFDSSHFHRAFKASYGISPREYRRSLC